MNDFDTKVLQFLQFVGVCQHHSQLEAMFDGVVELDGPVESLKRHICLLSVPLSMVSLASGRWVAAGFIPSHQYKIK